MGSEHALLTGASGALADVPPPGAVLLAAGNLVVDQASYRASVDGRAVELTFREFELLRLLAANLDRILSYEALTTALWHSAGTSETRRLVVLVCRLRRKLDASSPYRIETVRGRGYGLIVPAGGARGMRRRGARRPASNP